MICKQSSVDVVLAVLDTNLDGYDTFAEGRPRPCQ